MDDQEKSLINNLNNLLHQSLADFPEEDYLKPGRLKALMSQHISILDIISRRLTIDAENSQHKLKQYQTALRAQHQLRATIETHHRLQKSIEKNEKNNKTN